MYKNLINLDDQQHLPQGWNDDVNAHIFKYYPFYPRISKRTYQPELYHEQYCRLKISFNEFINDSRQHGIDECVILGTVQHQHVMTVKIIYIHFTSFSYEYITTIMDDESMFTTQGNEYSKDSLLDYIAFQFEDYEQLWYDIETAARIYKNRTLCMQYNKNYRNQMIKQYIHDITNVPPIVDINTFIIYYSFYLFILYHAFMFKPNDNITDIMVQYVELVELGLPENVKEMQLLMKPYDIKKSIQFDEVTNKIIFNI
jgi:hypothetical protein